MDDHYDLAVIGAGMGGIDVARRASRMGVEVAPVKRGKIGGT